MGSPLKIEPKGKESMDSDFLSILANAGDAMGNKILLMVYDTEMFSDYSTPGEAEIKGGKAQKINMAGIPLGTEVDYYFQSELEYLYNGDLSDAAAFDISSATMFISPSTLNFQVLFVL